MAVLTGLLGALASVGSAIAAGGGAAGAAAGLASAAAGIAGAALSGKKGTAGQTPTETSKVSPMTKAQLLSGNPNVLSSADTATSAGRGRLLGN